MTVVTPPRAAARVPVSQSSLEVVPQKGSSRWTWTSIPPGIRILPEASTTVAAPAGQPRADGGDRLALDGDVGHARARPGRPRVALEMTRS